jgi:hypothetical protein
LTPNPETDIISPHEIDLSQSENLKLRYTNNTITILSIGKLLRFKLNKGEWMATLSVLGSVLFAWYVAYFTGKCHDYVTHTQSWGMALFGVIFGLTVWTSMVDPGYRSKDIYEGEPERTGRN